MLTASEQSAFRPRLEQLTNEQLLKLWDKLGLKIGRGDRREEWIAGDQEWLIGPLFADTTAAGLDRALDEVSHAS